MQSRQEPDPGGAATRERLLAVLRRGSHTVDELAEALGITRNAVRAQLSTLERDALVARTGKRSGVRKPSFLYGLTEEAERALSRAYGPVLTGLVEVLADTLDARTLRSVMRRVGERLAVPHVLGSVTKSTRRTPPIDAKEHGSRLASAVGLLESLGASVDVTRGRDATTIQGHACPLADTTRDHACVCLTLQRLLEILVGTRVTEQCERGDRPRCRFEVGGPERA